MQQLGYNIPGSWTNVKEFVLAFYQTEIKEFKPLVIKRIQYEGKNTKTKKPRSYRSNEA